MAINLNNFVDIQMKYHLSSVSSSTRETAVLIVNGNTASDITYSSLDKVPYQPGDELYYYCYMFFANGGVKLRIITVATTKKSKSITTYNLSDDQTFIATTTENTYYYVATANGSYRRITPSGDNMKKMSLVSSFTGMTDDSYYKKNSTNYEKTTPFAENFYIAKPVSVAPAGENVYTFNEEDNSFTLDITAPSGYVISQAEYEFDFKDLESGQVFVMQESEEKFYKVLATSESTTYPAIAVLYASSNCSSILFEESTNYATSNYDVATPVLLECYKKTVSTEQVPSELLVSDLKPIVEGLPYEQIVIASNASYKEMAKLALQTNTEDMSITQKMIISSIAPKEYYNGTTKIFSPALVSSAYNFQMKYGVHGTEMSIAAYLTKINIDKFSSVQDFMFTVEDVSYNYYKESLLVTIGETCEDNDLAVEIQSDNITVNSTVVNQIIALGGNDTRGNDLVNQYMLILVHQTLTERLTTLLATKLKYNATSLSIIGATISSELDRYVKNGYLSTDKAWTEPDLIFEGYTVISQNTALSRGYKYIILPFNTLSAAEKAAHQLPVIYILLADTYGIRKITITGEVY